MNYLAHAYLSFDEPEILVGNMISDFVKGKKKFDYPAGIQNGITLHRAIDTFTDNHACTKAAKLFFKADYRLYAGAFIDVVFDHFLATDINEFKLHEDLEKFCKGVYEVLEKHFVQLPLVFKKMFPDMKSQNWLGNYRYRWGIEKSFEGLVNRAAYLNDYYTAFLIFNNSYEELKICYQAFLPELRQFAALQLSNLSPGESIYL